MNDRMNHIQNAKEETKKNLAVELHEYYRKVRKALEKLNADGILTAREVEILQDMLSDIEMYLSEKDNTVHKEVKSMGDNDYISFSERAELRGRQAGRIEGELRSKIDFICKKLKKGMPEKEIAEILEEEIEVIQNICQVARKYAPDYNVDVIYEAYIKE